MLQRPRSCRREVQRAHDFRYPVIMSERFPRIDEKRLDLDAAAPATAPAPAPARRIVAIELGFASGAQLEVSEIQLYDRVMVERLLDLRVSAFTLLQADPASLPGQEDWALTPALLINAVNRHVSPKKAEEAERLLGEAEGLAVELRAEGRMFPPGDIAGIETPHPHLWFCVESVREHRTEGLLRRRQVEVEEERQWIHNGDPFVTITDGQGQRRDVRWSAVEMYRVIGAVS